MNYVDSMRSLLNRLAPVGTFRRRVFQSTRRVVLFLRREGLRGVIHQVRIAVQKTKKGLKKPQGIFAPAYVMEDNTSVVLYTDNSRLFPHYQPRRSLQSCRGRSLAVSLVSTTYNEKESIIPWLESIRAQSRPPDEVVIVDGGSQDGTLELLQDYAKKDLLVLRVISKPGANISVGRNVAISEAHGAVVACSDFGCRARQDWLEKIVAPFEDRDESLPNDDLTSRVQVSAGWFEAMYKGQPTRRLGWAILSELDPQSYLPSSRSIAFMKESWQAVGGYPEWLTLTGEDTCFDFELKRTCPRWAFVPEAVVEWQAPATPGEYWRKIALWSVGDGEAGMLTDYYWWSLVRILSTPLIALATAVIVLLAWWVGLSSGFISLFLLLAAWLAALAFAYKGVYRAVKSLPGLIWEIGADYARLVGFLRGLTRRHQVNERRFKAARGLIIILAVVPMEDTGGGARSAQIALELLRQGYVVVYIHKFPRRETIDLEITFRHPNLLSSSLSRFRWGSFIQRYVACFQSKKIATLVELPAVEFIPLIHQVRESGGVVVYDLLDDWQTTLGTGWYSPSTEQEVVALSNKLIATAPFLAKRLEGISRRSVALIPNAVNRYLFSPGRYYLRPDDLPEANWYAIYIGALWGDWFDWDLLLKVSQAYPEAGVIVIGDYRNQCSSPPGNLHFLGLKPQKALPAYLHYAQVAMIPWKVNEVTQATSPLKVYEYVAMGKPVVAPLLQPLRGLPGVYLAKDSDDFIANVGLLRSQTVITSDCDRFSNANDWGARVKKILELIGSA